MSPDGLRQILLRRERALLAGKPLHPSLARRHSANRNKTNSSIKPNKFHSKYVCFTSRKAHKERKICFKIRPFGFPQRLVMGSTTTAARKVVSSLTLIGPFKIWVRAQIQQPLVLELKFKPALWVVSHVTKTSLVVKETWGHAWWETRQKPAEVSLLSFHFASSRETSASWSMGRIAAT